MSTRRIRKVEYSDDELNYLSDYSDEDYDSGDDGHSAAGVYPRKAQLPKAAPKAKAAPRAVPKSRKPENPLNIRKDAVAESMDRTHATSTDVKELFPDQKLPLSLVVAGHVDAGKSTLMGHLLLKMKAATLSSSLITKKVTGGPSSQADSLIHYAWLLDEGTDERQRGITIDTCLKSFPTDTKWIYILDAPGHADYVANMILGAVQADAAVLVVDATDFDSSFREGGTMREHIQILRAVGIKQIVVAINKMDLVNWDSHRFETIKIRLHDYLTSSKIRFLPEMIKYVPVSGYYGVNIVPESEKSDFAEKLDWWTQDLGHSLLTALDTLQPAVPLKPKCILAQDCRVLITDIWRTNQSISVSARILSGVLHVGDTVAIIPSGKVAIVDALKFRGGTKTAQVGPGEFADEIQLSSEDALADFIAYGSLICCGGTAPQITTRIYVEALGLAETDFLCEGEMVIAHIHIATRPAFATEVKRFDSNRVRRTLQNGDRAILTLELDSPVALVRNLTSTNNGGRVILRKGGVTVAAGVIISESVAHDHIKSIDEKYRKNR